MSDTRRQDAHWFGPQASQGRAKGAGHPVLFGFSPALQFVDFPDGGGYPLGFLEKAYSTLGVTDPSKVLHLCSGSMRVGVRVDIRPEMQPTVVADCTKLPFPDNTFQWVMADPPYAESYAHHLYDTKDKYPRPGSILREAARVLVPGGRVGILHFLVPMVRKPMRIVNVWGVTTGGGYAIRAWSVFEKEAQSELDLIWEDEPEQE